jgi:hypothetical protein
LPPPGKMPFLGGRKCRDGSRPPKGKFWKEVEDTDGLECVEGEGMEGLSVAKGGKNRELKIFGDDEVRGGEWRQLVDDEVGGVMVFFFIIFVVLYMNEHKKDFSALIKNEICGPKRIKI